MENKNKLLLIDGSSVAFRAFFALYNQIDRFKSPSGLHTNAILRRIPEVIRIAREQQE